MLLGGGLFVCVGLRVFFYDFNKTKLFAFIWIRLCESMNVVYGFQQDT